MTTTESDCGCHGTAAPAEKAVSPASAARTVFVPIDAGADAKPAASAAAGPSAVKETMVLGGFQALNPQDGLFLRGEHLAAIQEYSRALTSALATASGTGIVHGLGVWIDGKDLVISPGLAVSPRGRLLLLRKVVRIALDAAHVPAHRPDGYWKVELHWAWDTSGSEPAFGSLCADECADGGSTIRPWRDEGVEVRIQPEVQQGFDAVPDARLRGNWLSSAYFESERANGSPWLVPGVPGAAVPELSSRDWTDGTSAAEERGVPLAIMYAAEQSGDSGYRVQVWTARRLVDGAAAHATWQSRLAMRPWSIFLAQILQFEAELIEAAGGVNALDHVALGDVGAVHQSREMAKALLDVLQNFDAKVGPRDPLRNQERFHDLERALIASKNDPLVQSDQPPLSEEYGLGELPPAGYISMDEKGTDIPGAARAFFGAAVDFRVRVLRADQVADEVLAAQHRDRIPLRPIGNPPPQVDILVPTVPADKATLKTTRYGWVAFVRRGPEHLAPPEVVVEPEPVDVYIVPWEGDGPYFYAQVDAGADTDVDKLEGMLGKAIGTLTYPKGTWQYPAAETAREAITVLAQLDGSAPSCVVALSRGKDRVLGALRAGLFGMSLDSGYGHLPVYSFEGRPLENREDRDVIVVIVKPWG